MPPYVEPGETVVDDSVAMFDDRVLSYLHPEDCPSRQMELPGLFGQAPGPMILERAWKRDGSR